MRLIDADTLKEHVKKYTSVFAKYDWREICEMLNDAPTVEAEPVKHGHWITWFENEDMRQAKCSECGMMFTLGKGRDIYYCGNCGAKMDEVGDDES